MADVKQAAKKIGASAAATATDLSGLAATAVRKLSTHRLAQNAAAGAGAGALIAVPIPLVGPIAGAVLGAGAGIVFGDKLRTKFLGQDLAPKNLHDELLKLGDLRDRSILSEEEFEDLKRKLLGTDKSA